MLALTLYCKISEIIIQLNKLFGFFFTRNTTQFTYFSFPFYSKKRQETAQIENITAPEALFCNAPSQSFSSLLSVTLYGLREARELDSTISNTYGLHLVGSMTKTRAGPCFIKGYTT